MTKPKWNLNTVYISERLQESLRPISHCAMTTAVNWYLGERVKAETLNVIRISVYSDNFAIFWKSTQDAFARAGFDFLHDYTCPTDAAGSVVAPAKQGHPQDDRNPSRAFYKKESKRVLFFSLNERRSCARRLEFSPAGSVIAPALNGIFSFFK